MKPCFARKLPRILILGAAMLLASGAWPVPGQGGESYVGQQACLECHEDLGAAYPRSPHGRLADYQYPGPARGCEACHGPGAAHAESGEPADIIRFDPARGELAGKSCLKCHQTGVTWNWSLSHHAESDVSCLACHRIHGTPARPALLVAAEEELCFSCHFDQKAQFQLPSHHPLKEGFMACTSCHDPHGSSLAGSLDGEPARRLCLNCHAQYDGPFIFEHSPVEEDCGICHSPHGAVANNLLRQNEPFICLQCHQPHFHAGLMAIEGPYSPTDAVVEDYPPYGELSGMSHPDGMKRVMLTRCTQCHQAIHGSDLPSQGISGQGRALNR
jgi:DmsE family decaheme c-type cytochrome